MIIDITSGDYLSFEDINDQLILDTTVVRYFEYELLKLKYTSVSDQFHFDMDPDPRIRFVK